MDTFSDRLIPANKSQFHVLRVKRLAAKFRSELTDLILAGNENNYFSLDDFCRKYNINRSEQQILESTVLAELTAKGWKCKTSFGGTGLFIYSSEKPPSNCYDDGF